MRQPLELHLPDLPEVPVSLGTAAVAGPPSRRSEPLALRLRDALSAYLPLLLMAALAASTWWLVKHTPRPTETTAAAAPRPEPDYTMSDFAVVRFDAAGRVTLRIAGRVLRHYPDTDRMEVDDVTIVAIGADGRRTDATARQALANGDGSEIQLIGGAKVLSQLDDHENVEISSEFLHAFTRFERLRSHLPVLVRRGNNLARAGGIDYDHLTRRMTLASPVRASFMARQPLAAAIRKEDPQ